MAMQLAVNAARFRKGCIYIDTEQKLSLSRLRAIASERASLQSNNQSTSTPSADFNQAALPPFAPHQQVLHNVTVHAPLSTEKLLAILLQLEDDIAARAADDAERFPVGLIVLDSIAAPARRDFGSGSAPQRAAAVIQSAQILKRLADQWNLAVVVINQIGTSSTNYSDNKTTDSVVGAALGTSWHHCVTTRIQLQHQVLAAAAASNDQTIARQCSIVKSNIVGPADFQFAVTEAGIVDV
jgi:RAD51-like protein 1